MDGRDDEGVMKEPEVVLAVGCNDETFCPSISKI
jgi:hypothetical protein